MSDLNTSGNPELHPERLRIEAHRHLISDEIRKQSGVMEYFDAASKQRIMTIPRSSESADIHTRLAERRVPVYPVLAKDDRNLLLNVPNDARTVQASLRFIARDVLHYKEIFTQVGAVLGRCALHGFGVPSRQAERSVLGGIAFSLDNAEAFGGSVHLLPPYTFDQAVSKTDELQELEHELIGSPHVSAAIAHELVLAASRGWEHARDRS